jgi:hypothetical protein
MIIYEKLSESQENTPISFALLMILSDPTPLKFGTYMLLDGDNDVICHIKLPEYLTEDEWDELEPDRQAAWLRNYAFKQAASICESYELVGNDRAEIDW